MVYKTERVASSLYNLLWIYLMQWRGKVEECFKFSSLTSDNYGCNIKYLQYQYINTLDVKCSIIKK